MAKPKRRPRAIGFETLESRETPSTMAAGAGIHALATRPAAFRGSGREQLLTFVPLSNGAIQTTGIATGRAVPIGAFSGEVDTNVAADHLHATATATLTTQGGDQLILNIAGTYRRSRSSVQRGSFTFRIAGGTGKFAQATGSGTLNGTLNTATASLNFTISGKLRT